MSFKLVISEKGDSSMDTTVGTANNAATVRVSNKISAFSPFITKWEFCFLKEDGKTAAIETIASFVKDFVMSEEKCFKTPCQFVLRGEVYGHSIFKDATLIETSQISQIEKMEFDEKMFSDGRYSLGEIVCLSEGKIFCATTASGHHYYFNIDEAKRFMSLIMSSYLVH